MRPHHNIREKVYGDELLRRDGQVELWETSNGRYGIYVWIVRLKELDYKLCIFRSDRKEADDIFDTVCAQLN